jgi:hypothetical protein
MQQYIQDKKDIGKVLQACDYFACKPWIIYMWKSDSADLFLTSLKTMTKISIECRQSH